jgi:hypothetical protein
VIGRHLILVIRAPSTPAHELGQACNGEPGIALANRPGDLPAALDRAASEQGDDHLGSGR